MNTQRRRTLARMLSRLDRLGPADPLPHIENGLPIGSAYRIGITGPLGSGKSTLINQLIREYRRQGFSVGIIAIDPTSPFTGGAVLGDRVRMVDFVLDDEVFIRSLATRGVSGGLSIEAVDAADLLDIFGFDRVIIETVGVGQTEVDVMEVCDAVLVVLEPSSGDGIQAIKAGLTEIADLFVVNKMDMLGADRFIVDLQHAIEIRHTGRRPDVLASMSRNGEGVQEVCQWLEDFWQRERHSNGLAERRTIQRSERIRRVAEDAVIKQIWKNISAEEVHRSAEEGLPVREAARRIVERFLDNHTQ